MAQTIIDIEVIKSFAEEIRALDSEIKLSIVLIDQVEKKQEALEINKENERKIKEFFEEKFNQNIEKNRYGYSLSISMMSTGPVQEGIDYEKLQKSKLESINKIKQKYKL